MVLEKIKKLFAEGLNMSEEEIQPQSNLYEDLEADSLDVIEIILALEAEFDVDIPDEDMAQITTIQELASYIEEKIWGMN